FSNNQEAAMNKHQPGGKRIKRRTMAMKEDRSEQMEKVRAKRAASAMASVRDLADALGIGLNQAYELVKTNQVQALRFENQRRYLIPRAEIARLTGVDISLVPGAAADRHQARQQAS